MTRDDMGPLPKIHPREAVTTNAQRELNIMLSEWEEKHELTTSERLQIVTHALSDHIGTTLKYCIRQERHEDQDKPGGWA